MAQIESKVINASEGAPATTPDVVAITKKEKNTQARIIIHAWIRCCTRHLSFRPYAGCDEMDFVRGEPASSWDSTRDNAGREPIL